MKLDQVTKIDKRNKKTWKEIDDDVISKNCDVMVIFYDQFGAIQRPDSGWIVCKT